MKAIKKLVHKPPKSFFPVKVLFLLKLSSFNLLQANKFVFIVFSSNSYFVDFFRGVRRKMVKTKID